MTDFFLIFGIAVLSLFAAALLSWSLIGVILIILRSVRAIKRIRQRESQS